MSSNIDRFTQVEAALALAGIELSVSEVHGTIVGAVASHMKTGISPNLLSLIEPNADHNDGRFAPFVELIYDLYRDNSELLIEGKDNYDLLLPTDDETLDARTDALATWSKGYLLGLLHSNAFSLDQLPENGPEIARDIMQISEAASGDGEETEEDWALAELHEYVKVGSQLIFEFIYAERSKEAPEKTQ